ncbi:MAG: peptide ABC transporter substrate-binding protein [Alicyclobacillaceae bacterium]|nr:peptide ABC transporter substrate-binding protein [Alicyclobacillaceae bacterium]
MKTTKNVKNLRKFQMAMTGAIALGVAFTVSGCGTSAANSSSKPTSPTAKTSSTASSHGTLTYALAPQTNITWYLPIINGTNDTTVNTEISEQMYKPLIWINSEYKIDWKSSLARKITYNKQGTVYHIYLNPKWHWSNGQPVTADDVLFTWKVIKAASAANAPAPWPYVGVGTGDIPNGIRSFVKNSKYELTVTLKKPANQEWFIYNGLVQIVPLPASEMDIHKNIDKEIQYLGDNATKPSFNKIVDGPFELVSAIPNQAWTLVPNPHYDGHKSTLKKFVFEYEGSSSAEFAALKTGSVNVGYLDLSQYGSEPALKSMGDVITPEYALAMYFTKVNMLPGSTTAKIFRHLYIRQAMQMGLDNAGVAKDIYHGYAAPSDGPIPTTPATQFLDPALQTNPYPYNPEKGKALLEQHGWKEVNGVMTKGSEKLQFVMTYVSGSTASTDQAILMKQNWGKEGIDITLRPLPFSTFVSEVHDLKNPGTWQIATGTGWYYNGPGFYPTGGQLFATTAPAGDGYNNATENALIAATHVPYPTEHETLKHFYAYENFTAKHLPFLWGDNLATLAVHAANVHGSVQYANASVGYPQFQYWTVN